MNDPGFVVSAEERRRLLAANMAAAKFFRRELLGATGGWPVEYLKARGAESVLTVSADWKVGYAPDASTRLADHLRGDGVSYATMVKAGLVEWSAGGDAVDRHRDQLMLVARDDRLSPVGFVGIREDGHAGPVTPANAIHRPSNVLVGLEEQLDLLTQGAVPVIVNDPMDAIAVTNLSRETGGKWVGIPVCEGTLSTAQARLVRRWSRSDKVIVVLTGEDAARNQTAGCVFDLALFFDRVRAAQLSMPISTAVMHEGTKGQLVEILSGPRSVVTSKGADDQLVGDLNPPARGPGLG
ncbi:hypothetical protein OG474_29365 [Kribbella sp. NBC_01505]|uniref:hypothetical protein n=1 Tax=Kribbella sp. NBC_01505 TaxID=2903580 RepID=UPI00386CDD26